MAEQKKETITEEVVATEKVNSEELVAEANVDIAEDVVVEEVKEKKAPVAKKSNKSDKSVISSTAVDAEESIDELLNKLIEKESSNGSIIGSVSADRKDPVPVDIEATKVALYSSRNASWSGYGSIYKGYNIFSKRRADAWLTRPHVRLATPAEIAQNLR